MKKLLSAILCIVMILSFTAFSAYAEQSEMAPVQTPDGLMTIVLPDARWYQISSAENTEMFSNGDCAIVVNLFKNGDKLPEIQSADDHHELIYTAACSTRDYVLYVTGYSHTREEFSGICNSINSIVVDASKITPQMLNHTINVSEYSIKNTEYTAIVTASGLNVRSDSSTDASIITTLLRGTKVTVKGTVVKNGVEIGWARIVTPSGIEGYVSTQFITAQSTGTGTGAGTRVVDAYRTGSSYTLYSANGTPVIVYRYSNDKCYDDNFAEYVGVAENAMKNMSTGELFYSNPPEKGTIVATYTLFNANGVGTVLHYYSSNRVFSDTGDEYVGIADNAMKNVRTGEVVYNTSSEEANPNKPYIVDTQTVFRADGTTVTIYTYSDWTHYDGNGDQYEGIADNAMRNIRTGDLVYSTLHEYREPEPTMPEIISASTLYRADGSAVTIYTYSDWSHGDDEGYAYVGVADNAMQNCTTGELVYTNPPMPNPVNIINSHVMYRADGSAVTIYTYSDWSHSDDYGYCYEGIADNAMRNLSTGEIVYSTPVS